MSTICVNTEQTSIKKAKRDDRPTFCLPVSMHLPLSITAALRPCSARLFSFSSLKTFRQCGSLLKSYHAYRKQGNLMVREIGRPDVWLCLGIEVGQI